MLIKIRGLNNMATFGDAGRNIQRLLAIGQSFVLSGVDYIIRKSGKPTCSKGEPKTDIYVLAESKDRALLVEIKISFKKENADFIENKTNSERAELLLGQNWKELIIEATRSVASSFENKKLIYKVKGGRTEEGSITLGWKYELLNKSGGELSGVVDLTRDQVIDVYAGTHLPEDKKNALVENAEREGKRQRIAEMTDFLNKQSAELEEYDEQLVRRLIEKVTIYEDKLTVEFKSGIEIDEEI